MLQLNHCAYDGLSVNMRAYIDSLGFDHVESCFIASLFDFDKSIAEEYLNTCKENQGFTQQQTVRYHFNTILEIMYGDWSNDVKLKKLLKFVMSPTGKRTEVIDFVESESATAFVEYSARRHNYERYDVTRDVLYMIERLDAARCACNYKFIHKVFDIDKYVEDTKSELREALSKFREQRDIAKEEFKAKNRKDIYNRNHVWVESMINSWITEGSELNLVSFIESKCGYKVDKAIIDLVLEIDTELSVKKAAYSVKLRDKRFHGLQHIVELISKEILESKYKISLGELVERVDLHSLDIFTEKSNKNIPGWSVLDKYFESRKSQGKIYSKDNILNTKYTIRGYDVTEEDKNYVFNLIHERNYPRCYGVFEYQLNIYVETKVPKEPKKTKISDDDLLAILAKMA